MEPAITANETASKSSPGNEAGKPSFDMTLVVRRSDVATCPGALLFLHCGSAVIPNDEGRCRVFWFQGIKHNCFRQAYRLFRGSGKTKELDQLPMCCPLSSYGMPGPISASEKYNNAQSSEDRRGRGVHTKGSVRILEVIYVPNSSQSN